MFKDRIARPTSLAVNAKSGSADAMVTFGEPDVVVTVIGVGLDAVSKEPASEMLDSIVPDLIALASRVPAVTAAPSRELATIERNSVVPSARMMNPRSPGTNVAEANVEIF